MSILFEIYPKNSQNFSFNPIFSITFTLLTIKYNPTLKIYTQTCNYCRLFLQVISVIM